MGFNIQPSTHKGGEGGGEKGRSGVHRRAASEAMKEQVLKQAKAQHEMLRQGIILPFPLPLSLPFFSFFGVMRVDLRAVLRGIV